MSRPANLLDEALDLGADTVSAGRGGGRVLLIEDCVETSGAFVLHHLIKRSLSPHCGRSGVVVFLSFAHPFSHYDRILRKMGCNLVVHRNNRRFLYHDLLTLKYNGLERRGERVIEDKILGLYGEVQKMVESSLLAEGNKDITIMIDDVSLIEVAVNGESNLVLDFIRYCYSLTTQFGCSLIILNHEDIYSSTERSILLHMEYISNIVIKAEPLATGMASDVHGQLAIFEKADCGELGSSKGKVHSLHFRVKENNVEYFYPGSSN